MRFRHATVLRVARFAILLAAVVMVAMFLRNWHWRTIPAQDPSLDPTYPGGTRVMTEELAPDAPLERGTDVVYTWTEGSTTYERFGRVQGLPGDEVGEKDGYLTVNGTLISPIPIPGKAMGTVPEGKVLILPVRATKTLYPDSRTLGFIPRLQVIERIRASMH